jgi:hypothetical protein
MALTRGKGMPARTLRVLQQENPKMYKTLFPRSHAERPAPLRGANMHSFASRGNEEKVVGFS